MKTFPIIRFLFLSFSCFLLATNFANAQSIAINEIMASNSTTIDDEDGDYSDWIEIYNHGAIPINLSGYGLTDDPSTPYKWVFPAQTIQPSQFILVWASDKNRVTVGQPLHTNFKLSLSGDHIVLTNPTGGMVSQVLAVPLQTNVSYGRQPNGTGPWSYFYTSTPGTSNIGTGIASLILPPSFSHASGLYTAGFNLSILHVNPNAVIIYTLDGSEPTLNNLNGTTFNYKNTYPTAVGSVPGPLLSETYTSNSYNSLINIYDRSPEPDKLARKNSKQSAIYIPVNPVRKATIVKARAFLNGVGSPTVARTYFIWSQGNPYSIPVISLQTQEDHLFDYEDGIYTSGIDFDTWRAANPTNTQYYRPEWNNYWRRGRLWEYPVNVELFESTPNALNAVMQLNAGLRIHGNNSRSRGIKSLRLFARSEYDDINVFEHSQFTTTIPGTNIVNNKFKRMLLRGDGSGGPVSYDVVFNRAMQPIYNGVTRIRPAIHFINGEYMGVTAIRDYMDDDHFALNFGLESENIAIVDCRGDNCGLSEGTSADYSNYTTLRNFIVNNDMADQTLYNQAADKLDMTTYIDHMVVQIYSANNGYERKFWKARTPVNNNFGDGKWRVTVQDFEAALSTINNWTEHWSGPGLSINESLLVNLVANEGFKNQFLNRFADVINTVFSTAYFNGIVDSTFNEIAAFLVEDENRYPKTDFYEPTERQKLLTWGTTRPAIQQDQLKNRFAIQSVLDMTLNVSSTDAGSIKINTIDIKSSTPGVSQNPYPWLGKYFHNIPITVQAIAKPGYYFTHWSGDVSGTNPVLQITPTTNMQIQANFLELEYPEEVVYFWLLDKDILNDTPLENLAATYASNGLTAGLQYNSCLVGYPFTITDVNWRKASLERKNSPTALNYYPEANNNIPYASVVMRGLQVKAPFKSGVLENSLVFSTPTTSLENIKFSLAAYSTGNAQAVKVDYKLGNEWSTDSLADSTKSITSAYQVLEFDFSNVPTARNNGNFQFRVRFEGSNLSTDNSGTVVINNLALTGSAVLATDHLMKESLIKVYPNPTTNLVNVESNEILDVITVFNIYGQKVHTYFPQDLKTEINLEHFSAGVYLIKVVSNNSEKTMKIIKK